MKRSSYLKTSMENVEVDEAVYFHAV